MALQGILDNQGVDVMAAANDHILGPARDPHFPVLVHARQIAGIQPAVIRKCFLLCTPPRIAGHHAGALEAQFADLVGWCFTGYAAVGILDANFHLDIGPANTSGSTNLCSRLHLGQAHPANLGHAKALANLHTGVLAHRLHQLGWYGGSTGK